MIFTSTGEAIVTILLAQIVDCSWIWFNFKNKICSFSCNLMIYCCALNQLIKSRLPPPSTKNTQALLTLRTIFCRNCNLNKKKEVQDIFFLDKQFFHLTSLEIKIHSLHNNPLEYILQKSYCLPKTNLYILYPNLKNNQLQYWWFFAFNYPFWNCLYCSYVTISGTTLCYRV